MMVGRAFIFAAALVLFGCSAGQDKAAAEAGVAHFHQQLNARQYQEIYDGADQEFRQSGSEGSAVVLLDTVRERLGTVSRSDQQSWRVTFTPGGTVVFLDYATEFTQGRGIENFIFRITGTQASLVGYHINSSDLMPMPGAPPPHQNNL